MLHETAFLDTDPALYLDSLDSHELSCVGCDLVGAKASQDRSGFGAGEYQLYGCVRIGPMSCLQVLGAGSGAKERAEALFPQVDQTERRNAFQHAYWHALGAFQTSKEEALLIGVLHELDQSDGSLDTKRDLINNQRGAVIGSLPGITRIEIERILVNAANQGLLACLGPGDSAIVPC